MLQPERSLLGEARGAEAGRVVVIVLGSKNSFRKKIWLISQGRKEIFFFFFFFLKQKKFEPLKKWEEK